MSAETSACGSPPRSRLDDREAALAAPARRSARDRLDRGQRRRLRRQPREELARPPPASPSTSSTTPRSSLSTQPASPSSLGEPEHVRPEADALDGAGDPGADAAAPFAVRGRRRHQPAHQLDQLAEHVVGARLRLLDPRDVLRAGDDDVVGEPLGGDPAAVVADHRDRREAARAGPRPAPTIRLTRVAAGREHDQRVALAPVGDHLALEDLLDADVVGDRGQDRRVLGQVDAPARGQPCGRSRRSATRSIASVAEPPLPQASSLPPRVEAAARSSRRRGEQHLAVLAQRLLAQLADLRGLDQDRARGRRRGPRRGRSRDSARNG